MLRRILFYLLTALFALGTLRGLVLVARQELPWYALVLLALPAYAALQVLPDRPVGRARPRRSALTAHRSLHHLVPAQQLHLPQDPLLPAAHVAAGASARYRRGLGSTAASSAAWLPLRAPAGRPKNVREAASTP